ncbi:AAA family ATPase [uncultured Erythrobacter sp.]|uniref:AAA family ATPase n=1 Tax=uncultured Erythrobacter sp. TaxID=263913 RepID=UPI002657DDEB|nr:AAA family ATPase [uncultured Erythrobacter sp.]
MAIVLDEQVNAPPLDDEDFRKAFQEAWKIVKADSNEEYFANLHEVECKTPEFLVDPFIPLGALTMLDGHPGQGKSLVTTQLAAAVSSGGQFAGRHNVRKGRVLFMAPEDDADRVLRPRLEAHGAKLNGIRFMATPHCLDEYGRELLRKELTDYPAQLVVIDPLPPFLAPDTNSYKATEVRGFMQPLALLARELNIAILIVRHLRKGSGDLAIEAGQGSMDFIAAVRSGLIVFPHPVDPSTRVLAHPKANWSATGPSLTFEICPSPSGSVPTIKWLAELDETADQIRQGSEKLKVDEMAAARITALLTPLPMKARDAINRLLSEGYSDRTIDRAKKIAGVISGKGPGAEWKLK